MLTKRERRHKAREKYSAWQPKNTHALPRIIVVIVTLPTNLVGRTAVLQPNLVPSGIGGALYRCLDIGH